MSDSDRYSLEHAIQNDNSDIRLNCKCKVLAVRRQFSQFFLLTSSGVTRGGGQWGQLSPSQPRTLSCTAYCYCTILRFKYVKCALVKANSVLRASLTSGFWDIYFKTVIHENTLQTCYHQKGCFFLAQNAPKIVCRPGSARTRWGSLQRSPRPLAGFKGPTSKEGEGGEGSGYT